MSYGNGIKLTAGFDVGAKTPLDSKSVVQTIAERDAFVTDNLVYEGLEVYVKDTRHKYRYNGTSWIDLDTQSGSESGTGEGLTTEQANQLTTAYEHSQTPHVSSDDIPTNISDLTNDSGFITSADLPTVPTKVSDLENDSNFVTNSKMLEAIANAQLGNGEDSDIDLSIYQPIEESTLTTTAKTIPTAINELKSSLDGITVPTKTSDLENDSGFITSIPSEYITETELETKGYLTEHQSLTDYAKKIDIPDVSDFLTEVPEGYVTDTKLSTELDKKVNKEVGKGLSTNDLTNELVTKINSSATEAFVTNAIANAQLGSGEVDLSGYATVDALNLKADLTHTHDQYLTKVPEEYITETELNAKGYLTEHQDISNLALKSEIPDVSSFITSDDLPTVPTKVSDLENDSNFITSIPEEYITETELNAKGYLTSHQDISGLQPKTDNSLTTTDKTVVGAINELKTNMSNINTGGGSGTGSSYDDTEVRALIDTNKTNIATNTTKIDELTIKIGNATMDTTATDITGAIKEVNGNLLGDVTFSADYKNIILNRKNGTNPYTIPISAIINNAKLIELGDIDTTDIGNGKTLIYDTATQKHRYVSSSGTDELVKMDTTGDAHYLVDLLDKQTIINDNGILKVKKLDGQEVTITEINYLKGLTMNIMDLVNAFANGGVKVLNTPVATYADLSTLDRSAFTEGISYIVYVLADETHAGAKTTYLVDKDNTTFFGNADSQRNFTTNPLDLANEVTGKLGTSNIDVDSLWSLLTIDDTYKTLTTTNNIFGTHGAKAMYDELVADISNKANKNDFDTHKDDTTIHITKEEKDSYAKKTEVLTNDNVPHIRRFYSVPDNDWNNAIEEGYYSIAFDSVASTVANRPYDYAIQVHVIKADTNDPIFVYQIAYVSASDTRIYIRKQKIDGSWTPWERICTTSIADVGVTTITPASSNITGTIKYTVKNGICYVSFKSVKSTTTSSALSISTTMPKPAISCNIGIISDVSNYITGYVYIDENTTKLNATFYNTNATGNCSFSYPVAEP